MLNPIFTTSLMNKREIDLIPAHDLTDDEIVEELAALRVEVYNLEGILIYGGRNA